MYKYLHERKIKVKGLILNPNKEDGSLTIETLEVDSLDYTDIQKIVEGTFDIPFLSEKLSENNIDCFINDEGKFLDVGISAVIVDEKRNIIDYIKGNMLLIGHNEEGETIGLTDKQLDYIKKNYIETISNIIISNGEIIEVMVID